MHEHACNACMHTFICRCIHTSGHAFAHEVHSPSLIGLFCHISRSLLAYYRPLLTLTHRQSAKPDTAATCADERRERHGSDKLAAAVLKLVIELYVDLAPPHVKSRFFGLLLHYVLLCMCSRVSSLAGGGVGGRGAEGGGTPLWRAGAEALMATALTGSCETVVVGVVVLMWV